MSSVFRGSGSNYDSFISLWSTDLLSSPSGGAASEEREEKLKKFLTKCESRFAAVLDTVLEYSDFATKYDISGKEPYMYLYTVQSSEFIFKAEVLPIVTDPPSTERTRSELTYHRTFEDAIERYTRNRRKPNPALQETRASDFCYHLVVKFEAIPVSGAKFAESHLLLREFQALQHLWESFRSELHARQCSPDQLVGFPMPLEFQNVVGSKQFDFPKMEIDAFTYYNLNGNVEKIILSQISPVGFGTESKSALSSFNYMSMEKIGPDVPYLMDLMMTQGQGRRFTLSTALKIYDQLLCRLMIMHKYRLVHCNINPTCLSFGCREASNVLYINSFDKAILGSPQSNPLMIFHDRFVSYAQVKAKKCHYLCDLESAFYVFLFMLLDRLPWDSRLQVDQSEEESNNPVQDFISQKSRTIDLKEKFWNSSDSVVWITKSVTYEYCDALYNNFSVDVIESLYAKMRESVTTCINTPESNFFKEIFIPSSAPYNCYFGIRKIIASYFRFESLSHMMRDVLCSSKLEMLTKQDSEDRRVAWDLSYWCWNCLDADPDRKRR